MSTRRFVVLVGQSNENGAGPSKDVTPAWGYPLRDPVMPNGGAARSMWPYLSDLLGRRGAMTMFYNTAVGSTGVAHSWCGYIRNWTTSMLVLAGSYVLSGGKTWKCTAASLTVNASTVTPVAGLQADGVTWSDLGVSTGTDVVGLCGLSNPRFDPNGYFAAANTGLTNAVGYDEKWCFISIGQTDKTMSVVAADYAQALKNATDYMLARGAKVALGFTCYAATGGAEAWYQSDLLPGYAIALDSYSGNANVKAGANLRTALGVLAVSPASGPGLQADNLHMNDAAYGLASEAWLNALSDAGW